MLPSGRKLSYYSPRLTKGLDQRGLDVWQITYLGVTDKNNWSRKFIHGGKLTGHICQAVARDILTPAMLRVDAANYPIVLHVHDEIISEVPKRFGSIEHFEKLMMVKEPWFVDWPIKAAGGWRGERFRK